MTGVDLLPFAADETLVTLAVVEPLVARLPDRVDQSLARYSSPEFAAAAGFVQEAMAAPTPAAVAWSVLRDRRRAAATARLIARLPTVEVQVSASPEGRGIHALLDRRRVGVPVGRLARAVLCVPPTEEDYVRGRPRQALRTNVKHARAQGVTCRSVDDVAERIDLARAVVGDRSFDEGITRAWLQRILRSGDLLVAEAADRSPLVFISLSVDVRCAYLRAFMTSQTHHDATMARYLVQLEAVSQLAKAGVTRFLGDCALKVPPGVRHFQHLAGFTAAHVKVRPFLA